jgi:hypothetical protein
LPLSFGSSFERRPCLLDLIHSRVRKLALAENPPQD